MQLKGFRAKARFLLQGPRFPIRGHRFPLQALGSPWRGPFNCLIVGHNPGFNCIGPRGVSKNIGLGLTHYSQIFFRNYFSLRVIALFMRNLNLRVTHFGVTHPKCFAELFLDRITHNDPNFLKSAPRMLVQMKVFHVGSHQFRESVWELLRELWLSYRSSRGMPF